ncbi:hypothetical protein [Paenibacillus sp. HB172176]|uniref:hypothetical protein n=1 Tax=Paenibacillus sp. HB172176 TaxID=2493690 RepID=UPI00143B9F62|nr:hypothetical protein [Paenibacillus sp. HB172176]
MEGKLSPKQQKRKQEREMIDEYHKKVTEEALEPLYQSFVEWKFGSLPYYELTELIHQFHKQNQEIYKDFNYQDRHVLLLLAKYKLGRLTEEELEENRPLLDLWGYNDNDATSD